MRGDVHEQPCKGQAGGDMNRQQFIFSAVNAIACKRHDAVTEDLLAEAVRREIESAKPDLCLKAAAAGSGE